jgi:hypothetical protein
LPRRSRPERPTRAWRFAAPGIGISIAVNRHPAARAALVSEPLSRSLAREHNDANVIAMGARLVGITMAKACLDASSPPLSEASATSAASRNSLPQASRRNPHEHQPSQRFRPPPDGSFSNRLRSTDSAVADAIAAEIDRQQNQIELIASVILSSRQCLEAQGSVLTNKICRGLSGQSVTIRAAAPSDAVETLAIDAPAKKLFGCGFVSVQPHSGPRAERAVMLSADEAGRHDPRMSWPRDGLLTTDARPAMSGQVVQCDPIWRACARII